jgi:two-component system phosphate regulon response regulator PhoB
MPGAILIVDDEMGIRELLKVALRPLNLNILEASDGDEALCRVGEARPDLVILDLMMPRMDGADVVRALRRDPYTAGLPVVVFSAYPLSKAEQRELDIAPSRILRKGQLSMQHLRETVTLLLEGVYN